MHVLAKTAAWIGIPLICAEPVASAVFSVGQFGLETPWRLTVPQILTAVPTYLWYFPHSPSVRWWAEFGSVVGLGVVAVPTLCLAYALWVRRRRLRPAIPGQPSTVPQRAASRVHGDADWLSMEDAHSIFPGEHPEWGGVPVGEAYRPDLDRTNRPFDEAAPETWGRGGKAPLLLSPLTTGAISGIIIAGSGSLKTTSFTLPAMCTWRGSVVVLDPSSQVGAMVESLRREIGQTVALVDPERGTGSFNVLGCIDLADKLAPTHIDEFINWCIPQDEVAKGGKESQFFADAARELGACLLADMLFDESIPRAQRTVREWRRRIVTPEEGMRKLLARIYAHSPSEYARDLAGSLMRTVKETFSGIYKHCGTATRFLSIPTFADLLSDQSFDPTELTEGQMTVVVQIPDDVMKATPAVARIVIGSLARIAFAAKGKVATPIPFILDEMDLLGNMPILATLRDLGRKSQIPLFPMWQSIGQIAKTWGEDGKKAWYASAGWRLYAAVNDEDTAKEVSARCGTFTVLVRSEGGSVNQPSAMALTGQRTVGVNSSISEQRRDLLSPYEVQTALRPDEAILIPKGRPALRCGRPLYWRRPEMARRIAADQFRRQPEDAL